MYKDKPFMYDYHDKDINEIFSKHISKPDELKGALAKGKPQLKFKPQGTPKKVDGQLVWPHFA